MTNLLENGLKYSPPGSMVQIASWAVGDPARIEVRICDQSIGIPADQLEAILERFYRMPQVRLSWMTTPASEGIGLGLAICANIVRAHQGRIWAEGKSGEGQHMSLRCQFLLLSPRANCLN